MTHRVLYNGPLYPSWLDAIDRLRAERGWEPVYLFSDSTVLGADQVESITSRYPCAVVHERGDAIRGVPALPLAASPTALDLPVLETMSRFMHPFMTVCQRCDNRGTFTYRQRLETYHRLAAYWLSALEAQAIDLVVFHESPHLPHDMALFATAKHLGIMTMMMYWTHLPALCFVREDFAVLPLALRECAAQVEGGASPEPAIRDEVRCTLETLSAQEYVPPSYISEQFRRVEKAKAAQPARRAARGLASPKKWLRYSAYLYEQAKVFVRNTGPVPQRYLKPLNRRFEDGPMTYREWLSHKRYARRYTRALRCAYEAACGPVDLGCSFVYFPLHYQPERTTMPEGGHFEDQRLVVDLLSEALPEGWLLYVREHPTQLIGDPTLEAERGRSATFYDDVLRHRNVRLVSTTVPSWELIDASRGVATLTGTAGWEALVRGKRVLAFGDAWYRWMEGCSYVPEREALSEATSLLDAGIPVDRGRLLRQVAAACEIGYPLPADFYRSPSGEYGEILAHALGTEHRRFERQG
ncbi:MAG: hypothetical protein IBX63_05295 [Coriobacteriia bacterium]|nr:hypothetical protein [Coriobacteriia bacterium]